MVPRLVQRVGRPAYDSWSVLQSQVSTTHILLGSLFGTGKGVTLMLEVRSVMSQQVLEASVRPLPELGPKRVLLGLSTLSPVKEAIL